jgi:hypothetical protein
MSELCEASCYVKYQIYGTYHELMLACELEPHPEPTAIDGKPHRMVVAFEWVGDHRKVPKIINPAIQHIRTQVKE